MIAEVVNILIDGLKTTQAMQLSKGAEKQIMQVTENKIKQAA